MTEPRPPSLPAHAPSRLARLQQVLTLGVLVAAAVWVYRVWPSSPALALGGAMAFLMGYAVTLGLQFCLMSLVNRQDPAPPASVWAQCKAWWHEVGVAAQVFAWWQPFCWRRWPDSAAHAPGAWGRTGVVLVHGFVCNRGLWLPWMQAFRRLDRPYAAVSLEPVFGSIDDYATAIDEAVGRVQALTGRPVWLICHSMGGLAVRAWLAGTPGAAARVGRVVTLGTPHRGTWLARFSRAPNGRQMRIGSLWIRSLEEREAAQTAPRPPWTCWYSNADNIVFPASTASLPGADNRLLPGVAHMALVYHPTVMRESLAMLASADKSPSARTDS